MTDREKVKKGLECCTKGDACISDCPYFKEVPMTDGKCITALQADALALLKEQEKRIIELEGKLRLLEYGDQDTLQDILMPAT